MTKKRSHTDTTLKLAADFPATVKALLATPPTPPATDILKAAKPTKPRRTRQGRRVKRSPGL